MSDTELQLPADYDIPEWEDESDDGCPDLNELKRIAALFDPSHKLAASDLPEDLAYDNTQRGASAALALKAYADVKYGVAFGSEVLSAVVSDFISDLMHLCDGTHIDFLNALDMGAIHHEAELGGAVW